MGTVLELSNLELPTRTQVGPATPWHAIKPAAAVPQSAWLTATIRPAGIFGRNDASRLRVLLDALSACASIVVLDLQAARLGKQKRTQRAPATREGGWGPLGATSCTSLWGVDLSSSGLERH